MTILVFLMSKSSISFDRHISSLGVKGPVPDEPINGWGVYKCLGHVEDQEPGNRWSVVSSSTHHFEVDINVVER